jgi:integrase/recombinase XerD
MLLGALAGLRCSEVARLHTDEIRLDGIPPVLVVRAGTGGKDRVVPLHPELQARLRAIPAGAGWLFPSPTGFDRPVRPDAIAERVSNAFARVGVTATSHQLRHFFGTAAAAAADGNVLLVARLMGHQNPNTTMGYISFSDAGAADVVNRIANPAPTDELARRRATG